jgi:sterol desaturase/sphingolipid hydroxylase (fatty acid hydroxylase superfamily)
LALQVIDLKAILIIALIFIPLERIFSLHPGQKLFRRHWVNDLIYLFLNGILIKAGLLLILGASVFAINWAVPEAVGTAVRLQPLWLQAIEVIIVADIGFYLAHRAFHAFPFLWRFHAVHHSIEEMDWLAAHRVHPFDQIATKACSLLPVLALGFSEAAIAVFALTYQWQSLLIHSNIRINFGPLKWLFASPQFHHWHHANEKDAYDKNFAAQLPIIDALGGSLFLPAARMPGKYGTNDPVPNQYHLQLAYPWWQKPKQDGPAGAKLDGVETKSP